MFSGKSSQTYSLDTILTTTIIIVLLYSANRFFAEAFIFYFSSL
jgi:hypothetical protein